MKGQAEVVIFILLFLIGLTLFSSATIWGKGIFEENVGFNKLEAAEKFMKDLDSGITNVIKFGGMREINFPLEGTIELLDPETIEVRIPISISIQENWINISESGSYIMERKEGSDLVLRLVYPMGSYKVIFFTDGSSLAQPDYIRLEKNSTFQSYPPMIKIKITFV